MKKLMFIFITIIAVIILAYLFLVVSSFKHYPVDYGISFNQNLVEVLELDWKKAYTDMLTDLHPTYLRIAAMWSEVEKVEGTYNFQDVDWMMNEAEKNGTKVTLVVGQKAPRWPECHVPEWVDALSEKEYQNKLLAYVNAVVERYKDNKALELWQVENEPFIDFKFGDCSRFRQDLTDDEVKLVKRLDDVHWIMITDSGEMSWWQKAGHAGDIFGTTLYRIVRTPQGYIWTYDWLPASFYRFKAMLAGIRPERFYVAELQAEPWFTSSGILDTPLEEQAKTMNIKRLQKHIDYVERVGTRRAYLWGVEWWYWMKESKGDASYWDLVKNVLKK